ncbi:MAG TPA: CoA pyrophosphatase [Flavipsychrobacter sp.]|nr:CoA pyrophosphatase [Flavipsychrobacter sp.]
MDYLQQIDWLKKRLQQPLAGLNAQELMAARVLPMPIVIPENARPSAVLCLLFPVNDKLNVLLMKRKEDRSAHSAQISFPGGKQEHFDADLKATALREAQEEVGILSSEINILGALTPLYIPVSNFQVYPFVGFSEKKLTYNLSKSEVAYVVELPLNSLFHKDRKTITDVVSPATPDVIRKVKAYRLEDGTIIWGATAMILSELEVIMQEYRS